MTTLPTKLAPILARLLAESADSRQVTLDEVGEAIGVLAVSTDDVDALLAALEKEGRQVKGPEGQRGVGNLRKVLPAARALTGSLGRAPTPAELAELTGLSEDDVRHALALGRVMGR
jgi:DNA-directed RNA polymerase sigma subunit (sigma70/sigma32)